ncbi:DNA repair and recombination protein RAD26 [Smittium mucronatum]|uniref:DNA repair and recombination protein RAD26 n=1 Tax=Smittium mucronatum TaxID=133383 RepID=A0A1R0GRH4_9FUNG|nr:DNA repair and recombination protein RAD26 [Smittium mucronatum]
MEFRSEIEKELFGSDDSLDQPETTAEIDLLLKLGKDVDILEQTNLEKQVKNLINANSDNQQEIIEKQIDAEASNLKRKLICEKKENKFDASKTKDIAEIHTKSYTIKNEFNSCPSGPKDSAKTLITNADLSEYGIKKSVTKEFNIVPQRGAAKKSLISIKKISFSKLKTPNSSSDFYPSESADNRYSSSVENDSLSFVESNSSYESPPPKKQKRSKKMKDKKQQKDDGSLLYYIKRLTSWKLSRFRERKSDPDLTIEQINDNPELLLEFNQEEYNSDPNIDDKQVVLPKDILSTLREQQLFNSSSYVSEIPLFVPNSIWSNLLDYQQVGVQWLYKLHNLNCGGILGDEMGLGKTVQIVSFLASIYHSKALACQSSSHPTNHLCKTKSEIKKIDNYSKIYDFYHESDTSSNKDEIKHIAIENQIGEFPINPDVTPHSDVQLPSLLVCPATLINQWVNEFHKWWPPLRIVVLHSTGSGFRIYNSKSIKKDSRNPKRSSEQLVSSDDSEYYSSDIADDFCNNNLGNFNSKMDVDGFDSEEYWEHDIYGWRTKKKKSYFSNKKLTRKLKINSSRSDDFSKILMDQILNPTSKNKNSIIKNACTVLITTFAGLASNKGNLLNVRWGYVILDEGHIIKNPLTDASLMAKRLLTNHRILISGTPIQNNLQELWNLFDFVYPGLLGSQQQFSKQFEEPITNSKRSKLKIKGRNKEVLKYQDFGNDLDVVYNSMVELRSIISPFLLRREKSAVKISLKPVNELVLVCNLSKIQRELYKKFISSGIMQEIFEGKLHILFGIDYVRKIANHPDLVSKKFSTFEPSSEPNESHHNSDNFKISVDDQNQAVMSLNFDLEENSIRNQTDFNDSSHDYCECCELINKSGKLSVLHSLFDLFYKKHQKIPSSNSEPELPNKVLVFVQTRQMLDIIESSLNLNHTCRKYTLPHVKYRYLRMDGTTPVQNRQSLVDQFNKFGSLPNDTNLKRHKKKNNNDDDFYIFLLTTKVGGLGLNLTSANKVIIFDPDWNPSLDNQAKLRSVRIGQKRQVTIIRLIANNTIETNIYYKQLYKQLLFLNVLNNPNKFLKNQYSFYSQTVGDLFGFDSMADIGKNLAEKSRHDMVKSSSDLNECEEVKNSDVEEELDVEGIDDLDKKNLAYESSLSKGFFSGSKICKFDNKPNTTFSPENDKIMKSIALPQSKNVKNISDHSDDNCSPLYVQSDEVQKEIINEDDSIEISEIKNVSKVEAYDDFSFDGQSQKLGSDTHNKEKSKYAELGNSEDSVLKDLLKIANIDKTICQESVFKNSSMYNDEDVEGGLSNSQGMNSSSNSGIVGDQNEQLFSGSANKFEYSGTAGNNSSKSILSNLIKLKPSASRDLGKGQFMESGSKFGTVESSTDYSRNKFKMSNVPLKHSSVKSLSLARQNVCQPEKYFFSDNKNLSLDAKDNKEIKVGKSMGYRNKYITETPKVNGARLGNSRDFKLPSSKYQNTVIVNDAQLSNVNMRRDSELQKNINSRESTKVNQKNVQNNVKIKTNTFITSGLSSNASSKNMSNLQEGIAKYLSERPMFAASQQELIDLFCADKSDLFKVKDFLLQLEGVAKKSKIPTTLKPNRVGTGSKSGIQMLGGGRTELRTNTGLGASNQQKGVSIWTLKDKY